jgi:hypothetical protein
MPLVYEPYRDQLARWPATDRHILAQFDDESVVVYQAYSPSIGLAAASDGRFGGGGFSFSRMSWIKPNFLWMMYRSGWATKPGQEVVLAVRLRRPAFDQILSLAVPSSWDRTLYATEADWKADVARSDVRLQWDPDHHPKGNPTERRAVQLGLRGDVLGRYAGEWLLGVEDVSAFVREQAANLDDLSKLVTPREDVYPVTDEGVRRRLGL